MLQYPINVYPDKVALDASKSTYDRDIHFTFKGDILSSVFWRIFEYNTQRVANEGGYSKQGIIYHTDLSPIAYNNDAVSLNREASTTILTLNNRRYLLQMMFTQTRKDLDSTELINVCDRYVSRGKIAEDCVVDSNIIKIEDRINVIYEWNNTNGVCHCVKKNIDLDEETTVSHRLTDIIMKIGNATYHIESYNYNTGEVELASDITAAYPAGTPYQLYANYLVCEQYYFEVASEPEIQPVFDDISSPWILQDAFGARFSAFFWQGDTDYDTLGGTMMKYYTVKLQKVDYYSGELWDVFTSDKIYSQKIDWEFTDDYDAQSLDGGNMRNGNYKVTLNCVLQNGMSFSKEFDDSGLPRDAEEIIHGEGAPTYSNVDNSITLNPTESAGAEVAFRIYRIKADGYYNKGTRQDKLRMEYKDAPYKTLIADSGVAGIKDILVSAKGKFKYMIVPYLATQGSITIYEPYVTHEYETDFYGYTITALNDTGKDACNKPLYLIGDTWKFMADISDTDNVQNFNHVQHVGYGKYASVTSVDNDYMSGTLTASLGNMNCTSKQFEDDIEVVKAWRRFISQKCLFCLRSQKGDVWLVRITDNGSTGYGESVSRIPVSFTFSWVECGSIDSILAQYEMPIKTTDRK